MQGSRFVLRFPILVAGLMAAVAAMHLVTDPYYLFHADLEMREHERWKPEVHLNTRLWKAHRLARGDIHLLFLGSSRVEFGLDPNHPLARRQGNAFNGGLPGISMMEMSAYGRHAMSANPIRHIVVGLDPLMFDARTRPQSDFSSQRLQISENPNPHWGPISDRLRVVFSLSGVRDTLLTLRAPALTEIPFPYLPNGQRHHTRQSAVVLAEGGIQASFRTRGQRQFQEYQRADFKGASEAWSSWQAFLDAAAREGIRIDVFFTPAHAFECTIADLAGQAESRNQIKRQVLGTLVATRGRHPELAFSLTDFSCANRITTEPVPRSASDSMAHYFDYSHFRTGVGDLVLDRLLGRAPLDGFGLELTESSIESAIAAQQRAQSDYVNAHPEIRDWILGPAQGTGK